jgi:hypothetical protein
MRSRSLTNRTSVYTGSGTHTSAAAKLGFEHSACIVCWFVPGKEPPRQSGNVKTELGRVGARTVTRAYFAYEKSLSVNRFGAPT